MNYKIIDEIYSISCDCDVAYLCDFVLCSEGDEGYSELERHILFIYNIK